MTQERKIITCFWKTFYSKSDCTKICESLNEWTDRWPNGFLFCITCLQLLPLLAAFFNLTFFGIKKKTKQQHSDMQPVSKLQWVAGKYFRDQVKWIQDEWKWSLVLLCYLLLKNHCRDVNHLHPHCASLLAGVFHRSLLLLLSPSVRHGDFPLVTVVLRVYYQL